MDLFENEVELYLKNKDHYLEFSSKAAQIGNDLDALVSSSFPGTGKLSTQLDLTPYTPQAYLITRHNLTASQKIAIAQGAYSREWLTHMEAASYPEEISSQFKEHFTLTYERARARFDFGKKQSEKK